VDDRPVLDVRAAPSDSRPPIVVLLVDDQAFVGAALGMLLKSELDIQLHSCLRAVDAIAVANKIAPAVVLQDLIMPDIDGLTLVGLFRDNPQTATTPIIVLSGNDDAATRARALAAGAKGYLVKLPPKAELLACIREHASQGTSTGGTKTTGTTDTAGTLDLAMIDGFNEVGDPDFTRHLIDQFLAEASERVRTLQEAAGRADAPALNAVAHSLKGSSMIMGAVRLAALCAQVEQQVAAAAGGAVTPALMVEIDQEFVRVQHALAAQREGTGQR
jgi:DNA-binding response OmpR family regulator